METLWHMKIFNAEEGLGLQKSLVKHPWFLKGAGVHGSESAHGLWFGGGKQKELGSRKNWETLWAWHGVNTEGLFGLEDPLPPRDDVNMSVVLSWASRTSQSLSKTFTGEASSTVRRWPLAASHSKLLALLGVESTQAMLILGRV